MTYPPAAAPNGSAGDAPPRSPAFTVELACLGFPALVTAIHLIGQAVLAVALQVFGTQHPFVVPLLRAAELALVWWTVIVCVQALTRAPLLRGCLLESLIPRSA